MRANGVPGRAYEVGVVWVLLGAANFNSYIVRW